jgi:hypothetical protein
MEEDVMLTQGQSFQEALLSLWPQKNIKWVLNLFQCTGCYVEAAQVSGCVATLLLLLMSIFIWQNAGPSSNATSVFLPDRCVNDSCFKWGCGGSLQCC